MRIISSSFSRETPLILIQLICFEHRAGVSLSNYFSNYIIKFAPFGGKYHFSFTAKILLLAPTRKTSEEEKSVMYQDDSTKPKDKISVSAKISNTSLNVQPLSTWVLLLISCIAGALMITSFYWEEYNEIR